MAIALPSSCWQKFGVGSFAAALGLVDEDVFALAVGDDDVDAGLLDLLGGDVS